jgi:hypothetical protein
VLDADQCMGPQASDLKCTFREREARPYYREMGIAIPRLRQLRTQPAEVDCQREGAIIRSTSGLGCVHRSEG